MALPVLAQGNLDFSLGNGLTAASADGQYRMAIGGSVQLLGFGTFEVRKRAARSGRNPKTGETIKIKASKTVGFKPSSALKSSL